MAIVKMKGLRLLAMRSDREALHAHLPPNATHHNPHPPRPARHLPPGISRGLYLREAL